MTFWEQLGASFSGQTKTELSQQALEIQQQIAADTLAQEIESQKLKYNPELSKQRTIQVGLIAVPVIIVIGIFIYIKYFR